MPHHAAVRAALAFVTAILAASGCRGDASPSAQGSALPPLEIVDGDSAALAAGFARIASRRGAPDDIGEAYLERARRRRSLTAEGGALANVPTALLDALDAEMVAVLREHASDGRVRSAARATASLPAVPLHRPGTEPPSARDATGVLTLLARPLSALLPAPAWAAEPQESGGIDAEPSIHERTKVLESGGTVRTRRQLRQFEANGRLGFELDVRVVAEQTSGGVTTTLTDELRERVDVSYCPDTRGIAAGRREYSHVLGVDARGVAASTPDIRTSTRLYDEETGVYTGQVDDDAELLTFDGEVDVSQRFDARNGAEVDPASTSSRVRGRFVGVAISGGDDPRRYVELPRGVDEQSRVRLTDLAEGAMHDLSLQGIAQQYYMARLKWRGGDCLEVRLVEDPDPARLGAGERTALVPEVRHRFDAAAEVLPLSGHAAIGTIEGATASGARVTYRAPAKSSPDAPRFRREGAVISLSSTSRRGRANAEVRIASAEAPSVAYRIRVDLTMESEKRGIGAEYTYEATVESNDGEDADEGELAGTGTYRGYLISRNANCMNDAPDTPRRLDVGGQLEATATVTDWSALGGAKEAMFYGLATTDWRLKPMFSDNESPYAESEEEREGLKGAGSVFSPRPIALTGRVTTHTDSIFMEINMKCKGRTKMTTRTRIERLR